MPKKSATLFVVFFITSVGFCQPSWLTNLNLHAGTSNYNLAFGGDATGTELFDAGLDELAPPPPPDNYYAVLEIADPDFSYLNKDIRAWIDPYETAIEWKLVISHSGGSETTISWNSAELPTGGTFTITGASPQDMRATNSLAFQGDGTVTILYSTGTLGDVNNDDAANSTDALMVLSCDVGFAIPEQFCPMTCGDANGDTFINSTDALIILSYDVGFQVPYNVGEPGCPANVTVCPGCVAR